MATLEGARDQTQSIADVTGSRVNGGDGRMYERARFVDAGQDAEAVHRGWPIGETQAWRLQGGVATVRSLEPYVG